ncbi:immunity protein Imm33 domain-containing protein [Dictyobacter alpinus]|nr:hypothetical protein [Dictyobacter alpinus]
MMQLHFRKDEQHVRWVYTDGLRMLGQRELATQISWPEHDPREKLLIDLLRFLEDYLRSQPRRILPGQTLRYGWTMLRFVNDEYQLSGAGADTLLIEEEKHAFTHDDPSYGMGVAHTLTLLQLQHEVMRRNHITGLGDHPSPAHIALTCARVNPETIAHLRPIMAHRAWEPTARESGWFIGCCDHDHNHDDPAELATIHLRHLVESFPGLFPYITMPVGYQIFFEEHQAVIFHPGEQYGQVDPEGLLTSLSFS